jgi:hypothetical protein
MPAVAKHHGAQPRLERGLWIGMLGPALLWLVQFQIKYSLAARTTLPSRAVVAGTSFVALVAVTVCGLISLRYYLLAAASPLDRFAGKVHRTRFMATLGMMFSGLFFLLIVAQLLADLFIKPGLQ